MAYVSEESVFEVLEKEALGLVAVLINFLTVITQPRTAFCCFFFFKFDNSKQTLTLKEVVVNI